MCFKYILIIFYKGCTWKEMLQTETLHDKQLRMVNKWRFIVGMFLWKYNFMAKS